MFTAGSNICVEYNQKQIYIVEEVHRIKGMKKLFLMMMALAMFGCATVPRDNVSIRANKKKDATYTGASIKLPRLYDRPINVVLPTVRKVLAAFGTITTKDTATNIINARVDKRHVTVTVEPDKEIESFTRVTYQVSSSGILNHDWRLASKLAEATFRNLIVQENPQP